MPGFSLSPVAKREIFSDIKARSWLTPVSTHMKILSQRRLYVRKSVTSECLYLTLCSQQYQVTPSVSSSEVPTLSNFGVLP